MCSWPPRCSALSTCFTSAQQARHGPAQGTNYLLYWYCSTNTDSRRCLVYRRRRCCARCTTSAPCSFARRSPRAHISATQTETRSRSVVSASAGTQFTCFTGTKVHILTQKALRRAPAAQTSRNLSSRNLHRVCQWVASKIHSGLGPEVWAVFELEVTLNTPDTAHVTTPYDARETV